ncbi:MAG: hypothetical protein EOO07_11895 [Chitinophagaceae bacterium]|nr:MAG: hypothetical protein EOO07_11895 [Chitinophagaceae bacterium]
MKKAFVVMMSCVFLAACSNNGGQTGVQNDGMKLGDTNGGRADTLVTTDQSATDTAKGEHRVDISTRDTFKNK